VRRLHFLVAAGLAPVLSACSGATTAPLQLHIESPALGRVTASVNGCRARPSLRALDLDANGGAITVRVVPDTADVSSWRFVVANRAGPAGPAEEMNGHSGCAELHRFSSPRSVQRPSSRLDRREHERHDRSIATTDAARGS